MAGFLYFRSGDTRPIDTKGAVALGLGYILDVDTSIETRQTNANSPSGDKGLVFADPSRQSGRIVGVDLEKQTWRELPEVEGRNSLWLGYWNDAKPTPGDLSRPSMLNGLMIRMADDQQWQVPIVRRYDGPTERWESTLPAYLDYDRKGNVIRGEPLAQYASLWDITTPLASKEFEAAAGSVEDDEIQHAEGPGEQAIYSAVIALLQANYVVDLPELVLMGAMADDQSLALAAMASCRHEQLMKWITDAQKKSNQQTPNGLTTTAGEAV